MCIDKKHYKCCCGCSLTASAAIIGVFQLVSALASAYRRFWLAFGLELAMVILVSLIILDKHSVAKRKIAYYYYLTTSILVTLALIIFTVLLAVSDLYNSELNDSCTANMDLYPVTFNTVADCVADLRKRAVLYFSIFLVFFVVIRFALVRVFKWGMLE